MTYIDHAPSEAQEPQPKNFGDETPTQRAHRREKEIDLARRRRLEKKRSRPGLGRLMLYDFNKFLCFTYDKHGPSMPEGDDAAYEHLVVLLHLVANLGDPRAVWDVRGRWCPWMSEQTFTAIVDKVYAKALRWRADTLAREIGLNDATRTLLRIKSIGANDITKEQRIERRNKDKARKLKAKRAALRAVRPVPASEAKPWINLGMSRSSWYAKGKPQVLDFGQNLTPNLLTSSIGCQVLSKPSEGASPPLKSGDLTRADSGIEADAAPAGWMLSPALTSDIEVRVPEPREAAAALSMRPAFETDIPEQEREGQNLRLVSIPVDITDQAETLALAAASLPIRLPAANGANGTPVDRNGEAATPELPQKAREAHRNVGVGPHVRLSGSGATGRETTRKNDAYAANHRNGQAARRPDNQPPHHKGHDAMARIAKNEPRPELFAQVKRWYPQEFVGDDDQMNFAAFELALDHGVEFEELIAGAFDRMADADDGREVPLLAEFLVSKCWIERAAA